MLFGFNSRRLVHVCDFLIMVIIYRGVYRPFVRGSKSPYTFSSPSLPFLSLPYPLSPFPIPSSPLWLMLYHVREHLNSPSRFGQSATAKRIWVHFSSKLWHFRSISCWWCWCEASAVDDAGVKHQLLMMLVAEAVDHLRLHQLSLYFTSELFLQRTDIAARRRSGAPSKVY